MKRKLDYQWVIIVTCFIMEFVALGFCSSNKSLYLSAITEALDIKRSLFSINDSIRYMTTAVINLFFGAMLHKLGARKMVAIGFGALIASMQFYAHAESVFGFYFGGFLLGLGLALCTTTMISSIIRRWVKKNTGTVLGFVLAANGLGGALAAQIVTPIIYEEGNPFGYRNAYHLITAILAVVGIVAVIFLRNHPKDSNPSDSVGQKKAPRCGGWIGIDYEEVRKKPYFYMALVCVFLTGMVLQGVNGASAAHMKDVGLDAGYVATVLSMHSIALMIFKFSTGVLYDKFGLRISMIICDIAALVVMVLLALVTNSPEGRVYAMIYGIFSALALPLETIMLSLITTDLFGNKSFDKILGIISALNTAGYAVGTPLMNWCYDAFGSYVPFIWVCVGIISVVTIMYQLIITIAAKERKKILAARE
jgi:MFS family permease